MTAEEREMIMATTYAWWWECRYRTEPKPDTQYWNEFIESDVYKAIDKDYPKDTKTIDYAIVLQKIIEHHCSNRPIPDELAVKSPYHSQILNEHGKKHHL